MEILTSTSLLSSNVQGNMTMYLFFRWQSDDTAQMHLHITPFGIQKKNLLLNSLRENASHQHFLPHLPI
jgi:hypothetical protein